MKHKGGMKGARGGNGLNTRGRNEGGSRGQWKKHKGECWGLEGAMDQTQEGNEGARGGQWMKTQGPQGGNEGGSRGQWMKHKGGIKVARGGNG